MTGPEVVVGGGIVGLSVALELLRRRPGADVVVLEKESGVGLHQSGHNSGVLHSGVYYAPGSLRARLCVEGGRLLRDFCARRGIPVVSRGKVIVATGDGELGPLGELHRRGVTNGVEGLTLVGRDRLADIEPHVCGVAALWVPTAAAVDFAEVTRALAAEVGERGGDVRCRAAVRTIRRDGDEAVVDTDGATLQASLVVLCAGLQSDRLARAAGAPASPRIVPFRGDFWQLRPERAGLVRGMVYPVPDPALPFLGVHATRRADGSVWLGPNAVLALAREGYRRGAVDGGDLRALIGDPDVWRLLLRHWRAGLAELARDRSPRLLVGALRRYLPELRLDDVVPGPCGIRAQAVAPGGRLLDDFAHWRDGPIFAVRNAPSPAATSALAIARLVVSELENG